ncbi:MAG TPA: hypothetical protein VHL31_10650 [Geminicoccus sp.]|jgi:hypothetical protein|uniref:hypothetical protein n=1 Tax=Geminicoccus sp. TaxID=2024832 RepID=UPI002E3585FF|nr:hypothetical protein [Geminicoccus sp.]HEX2526740.1 hypothetical protein [Geminicoccus sp.]
MNGSRAGLVLRVDRSDTGLDLLGQAVRRTLATCPEARFATMLVDALHGAEAGPMGDLRALLEGDGRLTSDAEITWYGQATGKEAAKALGATRHASPSARLAPGELQAVDLGRADLAAADQLQRLRRLLEHGVVHLALRPGLAVPPDQRLRFDLAARTLGFRRYEAANWALPGHEARWLLDARRGGAIMGVGPGIYGRWSGPSCWWWWRAGRCHRWRQQLDAGRDGRGRLKRLSPKERAVERLIDGLRLREGADLAAVEVEAGLERTVWLDREALAAMLATGRLRSAGSRLQVRDLDEVDELTEMLLPSPIGSAARP